MDKKIVTALITAAVGIGIVVYFTVLYGGDPYGALGIAMAMAVELFIMLAAGLILSSSKETKPIGNGILLGSCITLVIGFGVCTTAG